MMYVLITFYNRQGESNPLWEVYGHKSTHNNSLLAGFKTRFEAMEFAFRFGVPVMEGPNKYNTVEKLSRGLVKKENDMKYCADNSNCGYRIVVNGTPECKCGEYCAYQRPNGIALQNNGYHWCTCGQSNNTKRICDVCGKMKW